jgi:hypothetical protein
MSLVLLSHFILVVLLCFVEAVVEGLLVLVPKAELLVELALQVCNVFTMAFSQIFQLALMVVLDLNSFRLVSRIQFSYFLSVLFLEVSVLLDMSSNVVGILLNHVFVGPFVLIVLIQELLQVTAISGVKISPEGFQLLHVGTLPSSHFCIELEQVGAVFRLKICNLSGQLLDFDGVALVLGIHIVEVLLGFLCVSLLLLHIQVLEVVDFFALGFLVELVLQCISFHLLSSYLQVVLEVFSSILTLVKHLLVLLEVQLDVVVHM